ncbi:MAG: 4Fe-4S binding protein [Selenomonas sp.]|nr:4Fe-4S binding protein [Selenomonas sp.]
MMQGSDYTLPPFLKNKSYTEKCIGCYRCINSCPVNAIEQDSSVMGKIMEDFGKRAAQRRHEGEIFL